MHTKFGNEKPDANRCTDHYLLCIDIFTIIYVKMIDLWKIFGLEN